MKNGLITEKNKELINSNSWDKILWIIIPWEYPKICYTLEQKLLSRRIVHEKNIFKYLDNYTTII